jgi:WhiB family transcriptional regulator, redox-sensing transcriptional regulator
VTEVDWRTGAACLAVGAEWFYSEKGPESQGAATAYAEAKRVCGVCEVRAECLEFALRTEEPHGVWGGATPNERARMLGRERLYTPVGAVADVDVFAGTAAEVADRLGCSTRKVQRLRQLSRSTA